MTTYVHTIFLSLYYTFYICVCVWVAIVFIVRSSLSSCAKESTLSLNVFGTFLFLIVQYRSQRIENCSNGRMRLYIKHQTSTLLHYRDIHLLAFGDTTKSSNEAKSRMENDVMVRKWCFGLCPKDVYECA